MSQGERQNLKFKSYLEEWTQFEHKVRQAFPSQTSPRTADILAFCSHEREGHSHGVYHKQVYCGDEISVARWFCQSVGQVYVCCRSKPRLEYLPSGFQDHRHSDQW